MVRLDAVLEQSGTPRAWPARAGLSSASRRVSPKIVVSSFDQCWRGLNPEDEIPLSYVGLH